MQPGWQISWDCLSNSIDPDVLTSHLIRFFCYPNTRMGMTWGTLTSILHCKWLYWHLVNTSASWDLEIMAWFFRARRLLIELIKLSFYVIRLVRLWDNHDPMKPYLRSQFLDFFPHSLSTQFLLKHHLFLSLNDFSEWIYIENMSFIDFLKKKNPIIVSLVYIKLNVPCWSIRAKHLAPEAEMVWEFSFFTFLLFFNQSCLNLSIYPIIWSLGLWI